MNDTPDPWEVLRALRARPMIVAFDDPDEPMSGADAVDELGEIRALLDEVLADAPPASDDGALRALLDEPADPD